jgi:hypothetical protein
VTTLCPPFPATGGAFAGSTDRGQSDAYNTISQSLRELLQELREPISSGEGYADAVAQLEDLLVECAEVDWDGYGAAPIDLAAFEQAQRLLEVLPSSFSFPFVSADPDGEVSFDWFQGDSDVFSLSVGADGRLSYAGVFGPSRVFGTEFLSDEIPEAVLGQLRRIQA